MVGVPSRPPPPHPLTLSECLFFFSVFCFAMQSPRRGWC